MINGFADITHELTQYELELVPVFVKALSKKVGSENAVTNKQMVEGLKGKGYKITDSRVRKIINFVRSQELVVGLVASSNGYYVSNDAEEIERYMLSLQQRANAILHIKEVMQNYYYDLKKLNR